MARRALPAAKGNLREPQRWLALRQASAIYTFSPKGIERVEYKDTEHYRVTRDFLSNPQRMLKVLLAP